MASQSESTELDSVDLKLLNLINHQPYKAYKASDLIPPAKESLSLSEAVDRVDKFQSRLDRLVQLDLINEQIFYTSPKAKI